MARVPGGVVCIVGLAVGEVVGLVVGLVVVWVCAAECVRAVDASSLPLPHQQLPLCTDRSRVQSAVRTECEAAEFRFRRESVEMHQVS